ncbi:MAG: cation transporter [Nevskiaceae bacterium]|nr:MAG: cation transporter [Nevskiaceae bacterium]
MASDCCESSCHTDTAVPPRYRRALWVALAANLVMFGVEIIAGLSAHSAALLADAVDFFGDAANYGVSLFALTLAATWRSRTALAKGITMTLFSIFVFGQAIWHFAQATVPDAGVMGGISVLALLTNGGVAVMLYAYRTGDANMRSVWLCSRNDAIGNLAVMLAAIGVFGSSAGWPDTLVAIGMGALGLNSGISIIRQARKELRTTALRTPFVAHHP